MALQSKLFRGDSKLDAALVSDTAHVVQGANGPHVAKIQQALVQLDSASIATDGAYGPATATAVGKFKKKRNILNTEGRIDNIVGKKTIAALDGEMLAKESGGGDALRNIKPGVFRVDGKPVVVIVPSFISGEVIRAGTNQSGGGVARRFGIGFDGGIPSLQSLVPLKIVPFNEPTNSFILAKSEELLRGRDGKKNDLDTAFPPILPLTGAEKQRIEQIEREMSSTGTISTVTILENNARLEAFVANQSDGTVLMDAFFRNTNPTRVDRFDIGTNISTRIGNSRGFATEHNGITADITSALQQQFFTGAIDYTKMRGQPVSNGKAGVVLANPKGVKAPPEVGFNVLLNFDILKSEPALVALIGSFQAATLILKNFTVDPSSLSFSATLRYELLDHFGVDNSDVIKDGKGHGTDGQVAFWILQHKHRPGHVPYRFVVIVEKDITGTLLNRNLIPEIDFDLTKILRLNGLE